jgi:hypothetical protein
MVRPSAGVTPSVPNHAPETRLPLCRRGPVGGLEGPLPGAVVVHRADLRERAALLGELPHRLERDRQVTRAAGALLPPEEHDTLLGAHRERVEGDGARDGAHGRGEADPEGERADDGGGEAGRAAGAAQGETQVGAERHQVDGWRRRSDEAGLTRRRSPRPRARSHACHRRADGRRARCVRRAPPRAPRARPALGRVTRQAPLDGGDQRPVGLRRERRERRRVGGEPRHGERARVRPGERRAAGEQGVRDRPEPVEVGAPVDGVLAGELLGRHVERRAGVVLGAARVVVRGARGDAEVGEEDAPGLVEQDVLGLRSRCTMPRACACASASQRASRMRRTSAAGRRPSRRIRSASDSPAM